LDLLCAVYQRIGKPEKTSRGWRGLAAAGGVNSWMLILAGCQHAARRAWLVLCSKSGSPPRPRTAAQPSRGKRAQLTFSVMKRNKVRCFPFPRSPPGQVQRLEAICGLGDCLSVAHSGTGYGRQLHRHDSPLILASNKHGCHTVGLLGKPFGDDQSSHHRRFSINLDLGFGLLHWQRTTIP